LLEFAASFTSAQKAIVWSQKIDRSSF